MKNEKGLSLIEVMIATALLGLVGVAFLGAMSTASEALFVANERATAESLARSQMEYMKDLDYITAAPYNPGPPPSGGEATYNGAKISVPSEYEIRSINRAGGEDTSINIKGVPWDSQTGLPASTDEGLQRVRLVIYHGDNQVLALEGFKVKR